MSNSPQVLFYAKPSLRRAGFYAILYAALVLFGRIKTDLDPQFNPIWWACFGLLMVLLAFAFIRRLTTSYIITNEDVRCSSGILARRMVVLPLNRITNSNADQSFLERVLGLVNLRIDCAGGGAKEINFQRILKTEAREATRVIREQQNQQPAKVAATQDDEAAGI